MWRASMSPFYSHIYALFLSCICISVFTLPALAFSEQTTVLSLEKAIQTAIVNDPWLTQSQHAEQAKLDASVAAASLPNPVLGFSMSNMPVNGFAFNQEPMTQLKASISQQFARGQSLQLRQKQYIQLAQQEPLYREERKASTRLRVAHLWLDSFRAQSSIKLINNNRALFEQLAQVAQANYSSSVGNTRQQDILQADLELSQIQDQLITLESSHKEVWSQLNAWLTPADNHNITHHFNRQYVLPSTLPVYQAIPSNIVQWLNNENWSALSEYLRQHPRILAMSQGIKASESGIEVAKQNNKAKWGVNASYAYRGDDPLGASRADFLSLGISVDLPLFNHRNQQKEVSAHIYQTEAKKTELLLHLRSIIFDLHSSYQKYRHLQQRQRFYTSDIISQSEQQADASLNAYTNNDGDFAEVARANITLLNAHLALLNINVELLKTYSQIQYYLSATSNTPAQYVDGDSYEKP